MQDWKCTKLGAPPLIEDVWKEHIKDTRAYSLFCRAIHQKHCTGKFYFLHHVPNMNNRMHSTMVAYHARFGKAADLLYWGEDADPVDRPANTCRCLKWLVQEVDGLPVGKQRLWYAGKDLVDGRTLSECNITSGCTVQILLAI